MRAGKLLSENSLPLERRMMQKHPCLLHPYLPMYGSFRSVTIIHENNPSVKCFLSKTDSYFFHEIILAQNCPRKLPLSVKKIGQNDRFYLTLTQKSVIIETGEGIALLYNKNILPDILNGVAMQTGISTGCLYPMLTENSISTLTALGFRLFETFFSSFSELEPDYLDRIRCFLEKHGAKAVSLHPFTSSFESSLLFSGYERRFWDGMNFYDMFFRAAQRIGAQKVILHGLTTNYASALSDSEYFRRFALLQERAAPYGVVLLQENVRCFRSSDPSFLERMAAEIPDHAAFVLDVKQALLSGFDPLTAAKSMGSRLQHIHISSIDEQKRCVLPHGGCYDCRPLLQYLQEQHYDGALMIEVYRSSFGEPDELVQARRFLEGLLCPS